MEVRIRAPKVDRIGCAVAFAFCFFSHFLSLYISGEGEVLLIIFGFIAVGYTFSLDVRYTKEGVRKVLFGRTIRFFKWSDCVFIGVYAPLGFGYGDRRNFVCATKPLKYKYKTEAKWDRWWGNPYGKIIPAWKRKEEISASYHWVGDENYRKILELCGGERNVRETDLD